MINKNLINLMEQLQDNSNHLEKISYIKDSQELYDYCSSIVGGYSKEEFDNFAKRLIGTNKELNALSDDNLASISGGSGVVDWLKSKMPTMPTNAHGFRLKVDPRFAQVDGDGAGAWTNNISTASTLLGKGSLMIKMFEIIYFDDLDKMPPEEIANFILDLTGQT